MAKKDWSSWRLFVDVLKTEIEAKIKNSDVSYERLGYGRIKIMINELDGLRSSKMYSLDEIGHIKTGIYDFGKIEAAKIVEQFEKAKKELGNVRD